MNYEIKDRFKKTWYAKFDGETVELRSTEGEHVEYTPSHSYEDFWESLSRFDEENGTHYWDDIFESNMVILEPGQQFPQEAF